MTGGIVLAGGRSSRFGSDKLRVLLDDGRPLLAHAVAPLAEICARVAVVVGHDGSIPDGLPAGLAIVPDPEAFGGPVIGLLAGLRALPLPAGEVVLVAGGDMPAMRVDVLRLLAMALLADLDAACVRLETEGAAAVASTAVMPCAVRSGPAIDAAVAALADGDRRLRGLLQRLATSALPAHVWRAVDPEAVTLLDIDVPGDLPA